MVHTKIVTQDGTHISISKYGIKPAKATIIVASATGVPRRFYRHFAHKANMHGFNVYTIDYRGIGDSAPNTLKGFQMDYLDWAKQDLAGLVDHASLDNLPIYLVGHSYGGHALGLLPNADKIRAAYIFGTGAGWSGWMPLFERIKVEILWNVLAPFIVRLNGYLAWSKLGMGEDLPHGVYKQWKHWCQYPRYFFDDPNMKGIEQEYSRYTGKLVAVNAIDDKWAQPRSRDAFIGAYNNALVETVDLNPAHYQLPKIDHMGYFFKNAEVLWTPIFDSFTME